MAVPTTTQPRRNAMTLTGCDTALRKARRELKQARDPIHVEEMWKRINVLLDVRYQLQQ